MMEEMIPENGLDRTTEIARLEQEKKVLADQVKRLIRAETRLYEYQQELDAQLKEYQKLYELNRKFADNFDIQKIFEHALEYVIQYLEYERVVFFRQPEDTALFSVCAVDGYYDETEKKTIAELTIREDEGFLSPLYTSAEYLICKSDTEEEGLVTYRSKLLMDEYMVYPLGARGRPSALLAVGNSAGNAALYRRVDMQKRALLGMGNLVGLLSSTVENYISYTNMQRALDQERITEAKYRGIFENAAEAIFQTTAGGSFISCNPAGAAILGYDTPEEAIGSVTDIEHQLWVDPQTHRKLRDLILGGKDVKNFEVEFYRKDGTRQWALMSIKPFFNEKHEMTHMDGIILDISERKHTEEALRSSQQMLTNVIDNFPGVVFWKDLSSVYLGCNRNFSLGAGLADPSKIVGKTDYDLPWARTEADAYRVNDRLVMETGLPKLNIVETQLQADESIVWFDTNKVPLFDPESKVIGILGASTNVTESKKAEEELRKYREHLEELVAERTSELAQSVSLLSATIESTTDGILVVSMAGKIVNLNNKFAEMWHIPKKVIASRDDDLALACVLDQLSDPDEFIAKVKELYAQPEAESLDILHFKNGSLFERYSRPQRIDNQIVGRVWSFRDITARKQAEKTLQENAYFMQTLMDAIPSPIFFKDVHGVYQGCNAAFESYLGLNKGTIIGKSTYDIAPQELADRYQEMDMALFQQGGVQVYESSVRYADGTLHDVIFNKATYVDTGGNMCGLVGVILDITARKKAENELHRLNEVLEQKVGERTKQLLDAQEELVRKEKLSILGQLAGIVGHEIRNPLGVINNAVYFLKTIMPDASDTVKEYLDIIKHEVDNSQRIITDLLDFSRTKTPQTVPIEVNALVSETLGKRPIPENIGVESDIPDTLPQVHVDPFQMGQVLENLITNAIQAMPDGGTLKVAAREVTGHRSQVQT